MSLKSSEQGYAQAEYNTALMYYSGQEVSLNYKEAFVWFKKSADTGYAKAQYKIGIIYLDGLGTKKDLLLSSQSFKTA